MLICKGCKMMTLKNFSSYPNKEGNGYDNWHVNCWLNKERFDGGLKIKPWRYVRLGEEQIAA